MHIDAFYTRQSYLHKAFDALITISPDIGLTNKQLGFVLELLNKASNVRNTHTSSVGRCKHKSDELVTCGQERCVNVRISGPLYSVVFQKDFWHQEGEELFI